MSPRAADMATIAADYKTKRGCLAHRRLGSEKAIAIRRKRAHGSTHVSRKSWAKAGCDERRGMTMRSRRETVTFQHPFRIRGIDRVLPPGSYEVITDEEMIEGLSFPAFRRVATMIMVPAAPPHGSTMELISIGSIDMADAQRIDASAPHE